MSLASAYVLVLLIPPNSKALNEDIWLVESTLYQYKGVSAVGWSLLSKLLIEHTTVKETINENSGRSLTFFI
jgi:hypothetical protein